MWWSVVNSRKYNECVIKLIFPKENWQPNKSFRIQDLRVVNKYIKEEGMIKNYHTQCFFLACIVSETSELRKRYKKVVQNATIELCYIDKFSSDLPHLVALPPMPFLISSDFKKCLIINQTGHKFTLYFVHNSRMLKWCWHMQNETILKHVGKLIF